MINVGIIGASGFIGKGISKACENDTRVSQIVQIDLRHSESDNTHYKKQRLDVIVNAAEPNIEKYGTALSYMEAALKTNMQVYKFVASFDDSPLIINLSSLWSFPDSHGPLCEEDYWAGDVMQTLRWFGYPKRMLVLQFNELANASRINLCNLTLGNVFGPGDKSNRLIPNLIRSMIRGDEELNLAGTGSEKRDFIYLDCQSKRIVDCFFVNPDILGRHLNTGGGCPLPVSFMVNKLRKITNYSGQIRYSSTQSGVLSPIKNRITNMSKAENICKWRGQLTPKRITEQLKHTVQEWKS